MKLYISADIEGVAGIAHWDEAGKNSPDHQEFRDYMTADVAAVCDAALAAGVDDIMVKDAHGTGRNIIAERLPEAACLIRGWSGHPFSMVQELDGSFDALALIGYHSAATQPGNPLSHTLTGKIAKLLLNGMITSEFHLFSYLAASVDVPVVMISGDQGICETARDFNPGITAVATGIGVGASSVGLQPLRARRNIAEGMTAALKGDITACRIKAPKKFELELQFANHAQAYSASHYPGARAHGSEAIAFEADNILDILRLLKFVG